MIGVAIERDEACAIANHSLEPALANSAPAHLLQSFWLLSEHWACAAELSKPCLLYTSDAADEPMRVDLGGRRNNGGCSAMGLTAGFGGPSNG